MAAVGFEWRARLHHRRGLEAPALNDRAVDSGTLARALGDATTAVQPIGRALLHRTAGPTVRADWCLRAAQSKSHTADCHAGNQQAHQNAYGECSHGFMVPEGEPLSHLLPRDHAESYENCDRRRATIPSPFAILTRHRRTATAAHMASSSVVNKRALGGVIIFNRQFERNPLQIV